MTRSWGQSPQKCSLCLEGELETRAAYYIGLDLGQSMDYTALAVIEWKMSRWPEQFPLGQPKEQTRATYDVRHLQRFKLGTTYPDIVSQLATMLKVPAFADLWVALVIDSTGVGAPVVDLLRRANLKANLVPVTITGGQSVEINRGNYRVPKRDLVSTTKVLLQSGRLRFAELPETPILVKELLAFQVKIDPVTAHDSYAAWREGVHDDLVLALALACWYGESCLLAGRLLH